MPEASVTIRGLDGLRRKLDPSQVDDALRPAFRAAAILVESDAKRGVHRVTGKLQGSLGHTIEGTGFDTRARVGPQPGLGQPRHYSRSQTGRWQKPRDGSNRGDPRTYGRYEELGTRYRPGHPFLVPALNRNTDRIRALIGEAIRRRFG